MQIPILTGVQNGRISTWKNGHNLLSMYFMELNFQVEGDLDANCFFYIVFFNVNPFFFSS